MVILYKRQNSFGVMLFLPLQSESVVSGFLCWMSRSQSISVSECVECWMCTLPWARDWRKTSCPWGVYSLRRQSERRTRCSCVRAEVEMCYLKVSTKEPLILLGDGRLLGVAWPLAQRMEVALQIQDPVVSWGDLRSAVWLWQEPRVYSVQ